MTEGQLGADIRLTLRQQQNWRDLYTAAVLETDIDRLPQLIRLAEESISFRLISLTGCEADDEDLREIKAALESLEILKHERLSER